MVNLWVEWGVLFLLAIAYWYDKNFPGRYEAEILAAWENDFGEGWKTFE